MKTTIILFITVTLLSLLMQATWARPNSNSQCSGTSSVNGGNSTGSGCWCGNCGGWVSGGNNAYTCGYNGYGTASSNGGNGGAGGLTGSGGTYPTYGTGLLGSIDYLLGGGPGGTSLAGNNAAAANNPNSVGALPQSLNEVLSGI